MLELSDMKKEKKRRKERKKNHALTIHDNRSKTRIKNREEETTCN